MHSHFDGDPDKLELGQEVEYCLLNRATFGSCLSAENVRLLSKGTIPVPESIGAVMDGVVTRPLRCVNPNQSEYAGLIQAASESGECSSLLRVAVREVG